MSQVHASEFGHCYWIWTFFSETFMTSNQIEHAVHHLELYRVICLSCLCVHDTNLKNLIEIRTGLVPRMFWLTLKWLWFNKLWWHNLELCLYKCVYWVKSKVIIIQTNKPALNMLYSLVKEVTLSVIFKCFYYFLGCYKNSKTTEQI